MATPLKLAEVIAEELGVKAADVKAASIDPAAKIIFLGFLVLREQARRWHSEVH